MGYHEYPTFLSPLHKVNYVIQVGWSRWLDDTRITYLDKFITACEEAIKQAKQEKYRLQRLQWGGKS